MRRKFETLDVVKMFSTLTMEHWKYCLNQAAKKGDINKLMAWRYGLQAGLTDAVKKGIKNDKLDLWVIKRCRDLEKVAKFIFKKKHPLPGDLIVSKTHKGQRIDYAMDAITAKRRRDRDFEAFLINSSF